MAKMFMPILWVVCGATVGVVSFVSAYRWEPTSQAAYDFTVARCYTDAGGKWNGTFICDAAYILAGEW